ncbi:poly (3-hydroxybutyrate) depolymerase [Marinobacter psychrophilus]|jgi:putative polyhydroxyalkanoate system protein|uniref:Poly (3-hydroxybutyrate) depolymerase n=1 Tax=Marinobacter psychrophilus TaxID=330734 RepID=A0A0H4I7U0_9GAMM|nr:polyhydroxyalkanoic acid system family protein [Marinobacter psychrophilus]AKO53785.1 poly (3-hydroxybutyrate) depolymerase [Marinobacter psychrophilus]
MSIIDIHRTHTLDKQHAREAAETLAADLSSRFALTYAWEGDVMKIKRSGVQGQLTINHGDLHVYLELGLMLRPMKGRIAQEIESQLDQIIRV